MASTSTLGKSTVTSGGFMSLKNFPRPFTVTRGKLEKDPSLILPLGDTKNQSFVIFSGKQKRYLNVCMCISCFN